MTFFSKSEHEGGGEGIKNSQKFDQVDDPFIDICTNFTEFYAKRKILKNRYFSFKHEGL